MRQKWERMGKICAGNEPFQSVMPKSAGKNFEPVKGGMTDMRIWHVERLPPGLVVMDLSGPHVVPSEKPDDIAGFRKSQAIVALTRPGKAAKAVILASITDSSARRARFCFRSDINSESGRN